MIAINELERTHVVQEISSSRVINFIAMDDDAGMDVPYSHFLLRRIVPRMITRADQAGDQAVPLRECQNAQFFFDCPDDFTFCDVPDLTSARLNIASP